MRHFGWFKTIKPWGHQPNQNISYQTQWNLCGSYYSHSLFLWKFFAECSQQKCTYLGAELESIKTPSACNPNFINLIWLQPLSLVLIGPGLHRSQRIGHNTSTLLEHFNVAARGHKLTGKREAFLSDIHGSIKRRKESGIWYRAQLKSSCTFWG